MKQKQTIIVASGSGKRMGNNIPKQFIEVAGQPILMHTIARFFEVDPLMDIIVVLPENQHGYWSELLHKYNFSIKHKLAKGGTERFYSVLNGIKLISPNSLVAIHDGVRPLVSQKTIKNCFYAAEKNGAAIPVIAATESIRKVENDKNMAVNRNNFFMVQTPQVFQSELLIKAYKQKYNSSFTDDAGVVEKAGFSIYLVEGNTENIKITRPVDLKIAQALLNDKTNAKS
jgi:2-C-methyl-D-erythritol 4-phosphate cytidylyltransferase